MTAIVSEFKDLHLHFNNCRVKAKHGKIYRLEVNYVNNNDDRFSSGEALVMSESTGCLHRPGALIGDPQISSWKFL